MDRNLLNLPKMFVDIAEKSDKLIQDNARPPPQVLAWFQLIKETAQKIADGEIAPGKSRASGKSSKDISEFSPSTIPGCLQLVKGEVRIDSTRVSSFFPLLERDHLHGKKSANKSGEKTNSQNETSFHMNTKKMPLLDVENKSGSNVTAENSRTTLGKVSTRSMKNSLKVKKSSDSNASAENFHASLRKTSARSKKNSTDVENGSVSETSSRNFLMTPKIVSTKGKENSPGIKNEADVHIIAGKTQLVSRIHTGFDRNYVKLGSDKIVPPVQKDGKTQLVSQIDSVFDRSYVKLDSDEIITPVQKDKGTPLKLKSKQKSSSRNSSKIISLEQEIFQKKLKGMPSHSHKPNLVTRSSRFSMGKKKCSELKETHHSSSGAAHYISKASVTGTKEHLQCKEDIAAENLKKFQNARKKQIEEKRRLRNEKMERTKEKRRQLEMAKILSAKQKTTEPVIRSTRARERSEERITRSKEPKGSSTSEALAKLSQATTKSKTTLSENKNPTPPLKTTPKRTPPSIKTVTLAPPLKISPSNETPSSLKGTKPTPPMKSQPLKVTPNLTVISLHDANITKEAGNCGSLKRAITPTSPPTAKLKEKTLSASEQKVAESLSGTSKKPKLEDTASTPESHTSSKNLDSNKWTSRASSFTNYDMSEIVSDDDDDDDDIPHTPKPVPSWASGLPLRNALIRQYYNPVDTDELFGKYNKEPDLELIFDVKKETYSKRTSSAIWLFHPVDSDVNGLVAKL